MARLKTTLLLAALTGLFLFIGYSFGGRQGAFLALGLAAVMNIGSYWFSDRIVLAMYGAKEISSSGNPRLHAMVRELAQHAGLPMPRLYLVNLPVPNAFATGRNERHAALAVTSGILEVLEEKELRAVLAHELSHVKNRDMLVSTIAATLAGALSYLAQMAYWGGLGGGGGWGNNRDRGGGAGAIVLILLSPLIATLLHLAVSRSREYLADESGAKISGDPLALASALRKIHASTRARPLIPQPRYEATAHLFIMNPFKPSFLLSLFSTHPPVEERVKRLEGMVNGRRRT
ncbi:MAG: zinc metalloprotease HtpX [Candidatus Peribacteraceae bacterium]|jgi:heat shock protein HtpX